MPLMEEQEPHEEELEMNEHNVQQFIATARQYLLGKLTHLSLDGSGSCSC